MLHKVLLDYTLPSIELFKINVDKFIKENKYPQLNLINYYHNIFVKYARIKVVIKYPFSGIKVETNRLKSAIKVVTNR